MIEQLKDWVRNKVVTDLEDEIVIIKSIYEKQIEKLEEDISTLKQYEDYWAYNTDQTATYVHELNTLREENTKIREEKQVLLHVLENRDQDIDIRGLIK